MKKDIYDINLINYLFKGNIILSEKIINKNCMSWFQLSTNNWENKLKNFFKDDSEKWDFLYLENDDIKNFSVEKKGKFLKYSILDETDIFHFTKNSIRNRKSNDYIFTWDKILINPKDKKIAYFNENSFYNNKTYVLKFNKNKNYYFFILWILNSSLINEYFLSMFSSRKDLDKWKYSELEVEDIKNIPIPNLDEDDEIFQKIVELSKKLHNFYQEDIQEELNNYVMVAYKIFSDVDKQIINDFMKDKEELKKDVNENDLENYAETFKNNFLESVAWFMLKDNWIISWEIPYEVNKKNIFGISWVCFSLAWDEITEDLQSLDKELLKNSISSENLFDGIRVSRVYIKEKKYLFIIKPSQKKYWLLSNAYKDSLYENDLILNSVNVKQNDR